MRPRKESLISEKVMRQWMKKEMVQNLGLAMSSGKGGFFDVGPIMRSSV
jgi:hypothetical protein